MAHDHPHGGGGGSAHDHGHAHGLDHARSHGHAHGGERRRQDHGPGHNHDHVSHLHSHLHPGDEAAELAILTTQFVDGFREARDKAAYLRIAGVPMELDDPEGGPPLKLVDVRLETGWAVAAASPSFGSRELSWTPYPGAMVKERSNMAFVYVSLDARRELDLRDFLRVRA